MRNVLTAEAFEVALGKIYQARIERQSATMEAFVADLEALMETRDPSETPDATLVELLAEQEARANALLAVSTAMAQA